MYKILIADDEKRFREYLYRAINWNYYGFTICGEAKNGIEALEIAAETKPDIALLDINMPHMDGITLAGKLKEKCEEISIILITGYNEFEYARKALKLGVSDYILKPFNEDELLATLIKLKIKLQKNEEEKSQAKEDEVFLRERFLNMLIGEEFDLDKDEINRICNRLGIKIHSQFFMVASVEIDNIYELWKEAGEISLWKFAVSNMLSEAIQVNGTHLVFNGPEGRIISVINFANQQSIGTFMKENYQKLCSLVEKFLDFTITIGVGTPVSSTKDIRKSYMETIIALQSKTAEDYGKVLEYPSLIDEDRKAGFYRIDLNDKMLLALRRNDIDEVRLKLMQVIKYIKANRISIDYTNTIIMGLVSICLSYITEMGKDIESILGKDFLPYNEIKSKSSLDSMLKWLFGIYEKTVESLSETRTTRATIIVENVKEYIIQNYMDTELSVEKIARNLYFDSSYIRKVFTREMDTTVVEFISKTRIDKAKELLCIENLKLPDISLMVGFVDSGYFGKCFKKHVGVSPVEYHRIKNAQKNDLKY